MPLMPPDNGSEFKNSCVLGAFCNRCKFTTFCKRKGYFQDISHHNIIITACSNDTKVQTLGVNIWPGAKELLRVREAVRKRTR